GARGLVFLRELRDQNELVDRGGALELCGVLRPLLAVPPASLVATVRVRIPSRRQAGGCGDSHGLISPRALVPQSCRMRLANQRCEPTQSRVSFGGTHS